MSNDSGHEFIDELLQTTQHSIMNSKLIKAHKDSNASTSRYNSRLGEIFKHTGMNSTQNEDYNRSTVREYITVDNRLPRKNNLN